MTDPVTCPMAADGERVHRYVAGALELDALAEFETHLLGCAECQAAVREGVAVVAALGRISAPVVDSVRVGRRRLWWAPSLAVVRAPTIQEIWTPGRTS